MRLLAVAVLLLSSGCITTHYQENADLYRWRWVGTDTPKTLVAASVRLSPDGMPWAVRVRVISDQGEIVDYREDSKGAAQLAIAERGFQTPSQLHRTGNTPIVAVTTDDPELAVGMPARRASAEGGELSPETPLTEEEARHATVLLFHGKSVAVLAAPSGGRKLQAGRASLLADRGRTFAVEAPRRGAWRVSKPELVKFYAFLPLPLLLDVALLPVSIPGLLLHWGGLEDDDPAVGRHHHDKKPWEPPDPPIVPLPRKDEASE